MLPHKTTQDSCITRLCSPCIQVQDDKLFSPLFI